MLEVFLQFLASQVLYLALHLESGSFPRPLTPRQEVEAFAALRRGDLEARDTIIQHNLRLVAHIVKKGYCKGPICPALFIRSGTCYDPYRFKKRQKRRRQHAV